MEVKEAILARRSIRNFTKKRIDQRTLEDILKCAIFAPSAGNGQFWRFICITDERTIEKVLVISPGLHGIPQVLIIGCIDVKEANEKGGDGATTNALIDLAMSFQNIMLLAFEMNIGSCVVRSFSKKGLKRLLDLPDRCCPELLMSLGYFDSLPKCPPRRKDVITIWDDGTNES